MKKLLSVFLVMFITAQTAPGFVFSEESSSCREVFSENFESGEISESITSANNKISVISLGDNGYYNKALKLFGSGEAYESFNADFETFDFENNIPSQKAVLEFDIKDDLLKKAGGHPTLKLFSGGNAGKIIKSLYFKMAGANSLIYEGTSPAAENKIGSFNGFSDMTRVRLFVDITDENGVPARKISALYINGKNVLEREVIIGDNFKTFGGFNISLSKKSVGYDFGIDVDNIRVFKLTGDAPATDFYPLIEAERYAETVIAGESGSFSESGLEEAEKLRAEAKTVFYNENSTQSEINNAASKLRFCFSKSAAELSGFEIEDMHGGLADYITGGTLKAVKLKEKRAPRGNIFVIAAVYGENGELKNAETQSLGEKFEEDKTLSFNLSIPEDIRNGGFKIFVFDKEGAPVSAAFSMEKTVFEDENIKLKTSENGAEYTAKWEVTPYFGKNSELYFPAKYTANFLGARCIEEENGTFRFISEGGEEVEYSEEGAASAKGTYAAEKKNGVIMLPSRLFEDNLGAEINVNETEKTVEIIKGDIEKTYSAPPSGFITYEPSVYSVSYKISNVNQGAKVKVFYKDGAWSPASVHSLYYAELHEPEYKNGAFCGGIAGLAASRNYKIRIEITEGGKKTVYDDAGFKTKGFAKNITLGNFLADTRGDMVLSATYENIGYYIDSEEQAEAEILYRKSGGSLNEAFTPVYDSVSKQYRGSITGLEEDTEYEVTARLKSKTGTVIQRKATVKTESSNPNIAKTLKLSEIYNGSGQLMLSGLNGESGGWIKVICDTEDIIDAKQNYLEAVLIDNSSYLIVEGLKIRGGERYGINVSDNCSNIRISNCDISGWGRLGVLNETEGAYIKDGAKVNYDAGILLLNADNVTVERCYIHKSNAKTNAWHSKTWEDVHPKGSCGIYYSVKDKVIIRYNDIIGTNSNRFNDSIEGANNDSKLGGAAKNTDIYGNMLYMGEDDGLEIDGGQMNARVYKNRIEQFYCGISTAPAGAGPAYIFRNVITNLGNSYNGGTHAAIKSGGYLSVGGEDKYIGKLMLFNNTIDSYAYGIANTNYAGSSEFHSVSRNNIFADRTKTRAGFKNIFSGEEDDNNYDLISGKYDTGTKAALEKNGIITSAMPSYINQTGGNLRLGVLSVGKGGGTYVENFCEKSSDCLGAYAGLGENEFFPNRPADMYADRYNVVLNDKESQRINVHFGATGAGAFKLLSDNEWIKIENISGSGAENCDISFDLSLDMSKAEEGEKNGMLILRLDNGWSIPITVQNK